MSNVFEDETSGGVIELKSTSLITFTRDKISYTRVEAIK